MGCWASVVHVPHRPRIYHALTSPQRRRPSPSFRKGPLTWCYWWRGQDLILRPSGYEPSSRPEELPGNGTYSLFTVGMQGPAHDRSRPVFTDGVVHRWYIASDRQGWRWLRHQRSRIRAAAIGEGRWSTRARSARVRGVASCCHPSWRAGGPGGWSVGVRVSGVWPVVDVRPVCEDYVRR